MKSKHQIPLKILLADDDTDDRYFFQKAINSLDISTKLSTVENGELLISRLLNDSVNIPDVLFLDLNMPKKNGAECLTIIKVSKKLNVLPVVIYSTSLHTDIADLLYEAGAHFYIQKTELNALKSILKRVLPVFFEKGINRPPREEFIVS